MHFSVLSLGLMVGGLVGDVQARPAAAAAPAHIKVNHFPIRAPSSTGAAATGTGTGSPRMLPQPTAPASPTGIANPKGEPFPPFICPYAVYGTTTGPASAVSTALTCHGKPLFPSNSTNNATGVSIPQPGTSWMQNFTGTCAPGEPIDAKCWDDMHVGDFVQWWWDNNKQRCGKDFPLFSDCFYNLATPYSPARCSVLSDLKECTQPQWRDFTDKWMGSTHFYVAWNIFKLNGFFLSYYNSLGNAATLAAAELPKIAAIVNPPKTQNHDVNIALSALAAGFAFIPGGEFQGVSSLVIALQQTPGLVKMVYPEKTVDSRFDTLGDLGDKLVDSTKKYQTALADGLSKIQGDPANFIAISKGGGFIPWDSAKEKLDDFFFHSILDYAVSVGFKGVGAFVGHSANTDIGALRKNGTKMNWDVGCPDGPDEKGLCEAYWFNKANGATYSLSGSPDPNVSGAFDDSLKKVLANYTTPERLFGGAQNCFDNKGATEPTFKDGKMMPACSSELQMCNWNMNIDFKKPLAEQVLSDCPKDVMGPVQPTCNGNWDARGASPIPHGYLGGMLYMAGTPRLSGQCVIALDSPADPHQPDPQVDNTPHYI